MNHTQNTSKNNTTPRMLASAIPEYHIYEEEVVPERSEFVAGWVEMPITFTPR